LSGTSRLEPYRVLEHNATLASPRLEAGDAVRTRALALALAVALRKPVVAPGGNERRFTEAPLKLLREAERLALLSPKPQPPLFHIRGGEKRGEHL